MQKKHPGKTEPQAQQKAKQGLGKSQTSKTTSPREDSKSAGRNVPQPAKSK